MNDVKKRNSVSITPETDEPIDLGFDQPVDAEDEDTDEILKELRDKAAKQAERASSDSPSDRRLSSRQAAAMRKKKQRKKIIILAACFVGLIVLAVGGYFGANYFMDRAKVNDMNEQLAALKNVAGYASVADYQAAADSAESAYNQLPGDLRAKIDTAAITDARGLIERVNSMQSRLSALPTTIAFSDLTSQSAAIAALRTEFDALSDTDRQLLDESALINAEALIVSTETAYQPKVDFNAKIAAFTVVQDASKANIEAMISQLDALKAELNAATFDKTYVDTAAFTAKETEINSLVSSYSTTLTSERTDLLAKLTEATEKCDSIIKRIRSIEIPEDGSGAVFSMDGIEASANDYIEIMTEVITLIKSSEMFELVPGYTDAAVKAAEAAIEKVKAGRSFGNDTVITDSSKLSTFKGYFDAAKKSNSEVSVAVNTVKEGVDSFLATWVTGAAATADATPADEGTTDGTTDGAATEGGSEG